MELERSGKSGVEKRSGRSRMAVVESREWNNGFCFDSDIVALRKHPQQNSINQLKWILMEVQLNCVYKEIFMFPSILYGKCRQANKQCNPIKQLNSSNFLKTLFPPPDYGKLKIYIVSGSWCAVMFSTNDNTLIFPHLLRLYGKTLYMKVLRNWREAILDTTEKLLRASQSDFISTWLLPNNTFRFRFEKVYWQRKARREVQIEWKASGKNCETRLQTMADFLIHTTRRSRVSLPDADWNLQSNQSDIIYCNVNRETEGENPLSDWLPHSSIHLRFHVCQIEFFPFKALLCFHLDHPNIEES